MSDSRLASVVLVLGVAVLFWHINYTQALYSSDFQDHISVAEEILKQGRIDAPHFVFQMLLLLGRFVFPRLELNLWAALVILAGQMATAIIILRLVRPTPAGETSDLRDLSIVVSLMLAHSVIFLAPLDGHFYHGYLALRSYHNPTILLLKPLGLLGVVLASRIFDDRGRSSTGGIVVAATVTILGVLTKPSFAICLIPALVSLTLMRAARGGGTDWRLLVWGHLIPAVSILAFQYQMTFSPLDMEARRVVFAPFQVLGRQSEWLLPKFLGSVLFPLTVLGLYRRRIYRVIELRVAWSAFAFACFFSYFLAESGNRFYHGNFVWSGQITLFLLFVWSAVFWIEEERASKSTPGDRWLRLGCRAAFVLHLASGLVWYFIHLMSDDPRRYW